MPENFWSWFLFIVIVYPASIFGLGEILINLKSHGKKLVAPIEALRNLALPSAILYLILSKIIAWPENSLAVRISQTVMWMCIIYTSLTFLNSIIFQDAPQNSWQSRVPKIILDAGRLLLVFLGAFIILSGVWGKNPAGLITALGVGSLVIGFALQDSLSNIFSGIVLLFEHPFQLGDWINMGEFYGKVSEITWRSVRLVTTSQHMIVIPNADLAKNRIRNFNRPQLPYLMDVFVSFSYDDPPNKVKDLLIETAMNTEGIFHEPMPKAIILKFGDSAINYRIRLAVADYQAEVSIQDSFLSLLWYGAKRHGLTIPFPSMNIIKRDIEATRPKITISRQELGSLPGVNRLNKKTIALFADNGTILSYSRLEVVVWEKEILVGLYLVISGSAQLLITNCDGIQEDIGSLEPGDFFGERATLLSGNYSDTTVKAIEDLEVLLIDRQTFLAKAIEDNECLDLVHQIGDVIELRKRTIKSLKAK